MEIRRKIDISTWLHIKKAEKINDSGSSVYAIYSLEKSKVKHKYKKMLSHCTWWGEAEMWHGDTLTCAVLGFT